MRSPAPCDMTTLMSRGPGRVERAIITAFESNPHGYFLTKVAFHRPACDDDAQTCQPNRRHDQYAAAPIARGEEFRPGAVGKDGSRSNRVLLGRNVDGVGGHRRLAPAAIERRRPLSHRAAWDLVDADRQVDHHRQIGDIPRRLGAARNGAERGVRQKREADQRLGAPGGEDAKAESHPLYRPGRHPRGPATDPDRPGPRRDDGQR